MKKTYAILLGLLVCFGASAAASKPMKTNPQRRLVNVTPTALPATDITTSGFTANWQNVAGADGYAVFCYEPTIVEEAGTYAIVDETFNLVNIGSTVEPVWDEGFSCTLDKDYDFTFSPDWVVIGAAFAKGMVSGNLYTPYCDLTNDNGRYKLILDLVAQAGTIITCRSEGATTETQTKICTETGGNLLEFEFTNGSHDTYIYIVDNGIQGDDEGQYANLLSWFDEVIITQDLQPGDKVLRLVDMNEAVDAPATSCRFDDMKFLYNATNLCFDLYAAYVYEDWDDPWSYEVDYSKYSNMVDVTLPQSGVADVELDPNAPVSVYDLQGRKVASSTDNLPAGLYIVRQGDNSRKIIIK